MPNSEWLLPKLCLSVSGMGWVLRTSQFLLLGCVPLVIQPYVIQPLEELLPYDTFSVRLDRFEELSSLPERMNQITQPELQRLRMAGAEHRAAFSWVQDGLAYNHTILALCHRAMELRGRLKAGPHASCAPHAAGLTGALPTGRVPSWMPRSVRRARAKLIDQRRAAVAQLEATAAAAAAAAVTTRTNGRAQPERQPETRRTATPAASGGGSGGGGSGGGGSGGGGGGRLRPAHGGFRFLNLQPAQGGRSGFCNITSDSKRCDVDNMGAWPVLLGRDMRPMHVRKSTPTIRTLNDCKEACRQCARCNFVSFSASPAHRDCSWYHTCDMAKLHPPPVQGPDYQTHAVGRNER